MKKGEIYYGRKGSDAVHPIIYIDGKDEDYFIGAMITTSRNFSDNVLMSKEHFQTHDLGGNKYEIQFNDTHIVATKLIKRLDWKPFRKIGELTSLGINFIESNMKDTDPLLWEEYLLGKDSW